MYMYIIYTYTISRGVLKTSSIKDGAFYKNS